MGDEWIRRLSSSRAGQNNAVKNPTNPAVSTRATACLLLLSVVHSPILVTHHPSPCPIAPPPHPVPLPSLRGLPPRRRGRPRNCSTHRKITAWRLSPPPPATPRKRASRRSPAGPVAGRRPRARPAALHSDFLRR